MFEETSNETEWMSEEPATKKPYGGTAGYVTLVLIGINVLIFVAMVVSGVAFMNPTAREVIPWGASFGPLTTDGQWWRLLTACFVHFGIIHIGMNMFILFQVGIFTETLFGKARFLILYLLAGIGGNIAGLYFHPLTASAGASGSVFGVYGALLAFLLVERGVVPSDRAMQIGKSAALFIGYNLIYGLADGKIDMTAHIGGLLIGFVLGCLLAKSDDGHIRKLPVMRTISVTAGFIVIAVGSLVALPKSSMQGNDLYRQLMLGASIPVGNNGKVFYEGKATKADAQALAAGLNKLGWFKSAGIVILLSKDATGTSISIPFSKDESQYRATHGKTSKLVNGQTVIVPYDEPAPPFPWNDPAIVGSFETMGVYIAPSIGGVPIQVRLLNSKGELRKTLDIENRQITVGIRDHVWYSGAATQADAEALGKALQVNGFFRDRGLIVQFSNGADGRSLSFIVGANGGDDPHLPVLLSAITRKVANSVGGLPLTVHLVDATLAPKKTFVVQ